MVELKCDHEQQEIKRRGNRTRKGRTNLMNDEVAEIESERERNHDTLRGSDSEFLDNSLTFHFSHEGLIDYQYLSRFSFPVFSRESKERQAFNARIFAHIDGL